MESIWIHPQYQHIKATLVPYQTFYCPTVALHPAGLQVLYLPSLRTKEPGVRDISGFMDRGSYMSKVAGGGKLPVIGGTDVRLAHWLPGKPAEEHAPQHPFDRLSKWR